MFDQLIETAKTIRVEILEIYWLLLLPLIAILIILEMFNGKSKDVDVFDIIRRVAISILLLLSFEYVINSIAFIGDGIIAKVDKITDVWKVLESLGPNYKDASDGLFDLRGHALYLFSLVAYIVAYLGFFIAEALTQFVWLVLYIISPLMILAYIPKSTSNITVNLYKGLVKVIVWKILWTILGVLLLKMAMNPEVNGMEDFLLSIVVNLCIGLSMLLIPIATKSLINDGLETAASALAIAPAMAAISTTKLYSKNIMKSTGGKVMSGGKYLKNKLADTTRNRPHQRNHLTNKEPYGKN